MSLLFKDTSYPHLDQLIHLPIKGTAIEQHYELPMHCEDGAVAFR